MTDNMRVWDALKMTDPKYTKPVSFGRKFTSINPQWQLQRMSEHFGPVGLGWGYNVEHNVCRISDEYVLAMADVTIWTGARDNVYGPTRGMSPIVEKTRNGLHFDDDAGKKAMTDALTKGLSHLGLSADVFLGLFDKPAYVKQAAEHFKDTPMPSNVPFDDKYTKEEQFSNPQDFAEEAVRDGLAKSTTSTYEIDKRKAAEKFTTDAIGYFTSPDEVAIWFGEKFSKTKTNRDKAAELEESHPDLYRRLMDAAEEVRLRQ